jgi:hypothetical protein
MTWFIAAGLLLLVALTVAVPVIAARRRASRFSITSEALLLDSEPLLRWSDLNEVAFVTTGEGQHSEDVFLFLTPTVGDPVVFPCLGIPDCVLAHVWELQGFDRDAFGRAMASTSDARHVLWKRCLTK